MIKAGGETGKDMVSGENKNNRKRPAWTAAGWIITVIQIVISAAAVYILHQSALVPEKMLIAGMAVLAVLIVVCRLLMKKKIRPVRFLIGAVIALAVSALLLAAGYYVGTLTTTLQDITDTTEEVASVGVYVLTDDPAESIADTEGYVFGILESIEREDTDNAVVQINTELDSIVQVETYAGMDDLADALLSQECGAIVMSEQYVEVISELDGYEDFEDQVKEIASYEWSYEVETTETDEDTEAGISGYGVFTMYISGIDTYGAISTKSRSDVNIIAVVNTNTRQMLLISTPRDYYVPLSISDGVKDKLTHAGLYGVEVSMDTLEMLYGVELDYYFRVNFSGFEELIDALGGVTVVSEYEFDVEPDFHYVVGENELNGIEALAFARERYSFAEGDRQRGENQMAVITGVIQKLQTPSVLYNFSDIMSGLEGSFETNMPYTDLSTLVRNQISAGGSWDVQTYSVDGTGTTASTYSLSRQVYVMEPDQETVEYAIELIEAVENDEIVSVEE
ncbi:MAG: LCP family protein [Clostridiales bacterium]|nr:LCP family protein [Clostridiales bacterium]